MATAANFPEEGPDNLISQNSNKVYNILFGAPGTPKRKKMCTLMQKIVYNHKKIDMLDRAKYLTLLKFLENQTQESHDSFFYNVKTIQNRVKKYWKYRKLLTNKLVPTAKDLKETDIDLEACDKHILLAILKNLLRELTEQEKMEFFDCMDYLIRCFESVAHYENWPSECIDPKELGEEWQQLDAVLKETGKKRKNARDHDDN